MNHTELDLIGSERELEKPSPIYSKWILIPLSMLQIWLSWPETMKWRLVF